MVLCWREGNYLTFTGHPYFLTIHFFIRIASFCRRPAFILLIPLIFCIAFLSCQLGNPRVRTVRNIIKHIKNPVSTFSWKLFLVLNRILGQLCFGSARPLSLEMNSGNNSTITKNRATSSKTKWIQLWNMMYIALKTSWYRSTYFRMSSITEKGIQSGRLGLTSVFIGWQGQESILWSVKGIKAQQIVSLTCSSTNWNIVM